MRPSPALSFARRPLRACLAAAALVPALAGPLAADGTAKQQGDPTPAAPVSGPSGAGGTVSGGTTPLGPYAGPTGGARSWTACGGPSAESLLCAAVSVQVSGFFTTVRVQNLSGSQAGAAVGAPASAGRWVLTTVGFDGLPSSLSAVLAYATGGTWWERTATPRSWLAFNDGQFGGGERIDVGVDNGPGISGGIASSCAPSGTLPGGSNRLWMTPNPDCPRYDVETTAALAGQPWFEARFVTTQTWDPTAGEIALYLKGQNGPGGASYECLVGGARPRGDCLSVSGVDGWGSVAAGVGPAVVPEPHTVLLLGTGLAGVAALGWRRRRVDAPVERQ